MTAPLAKERKADLIKRLGTVFSIEEPNMTIGINATKEALFLALTEGGGEQFSVRKVMKIQFKIEHPSDLADLLQNLSTILNDELRSPDSSVAILKCSGGQFGSSVEAIKAEAIVLLAAFQKGLNITQVAPQSLKRALDCAPGQKWQDRSKELFNANGQHSYWSQGSNGAVAAAYKTTL